MLNPIEFFADLTNPMLSFLPKALAIAAIAAVVCGVIGTYVVLRGMAFAGDAISHAVFPGIAVAFVIQGSLLFGGLVAGITTAILVAIFSQFNRLREDSVIGVFFVASFALGIVIISFAPGYSGSLTDVLFGSITGITNEELVTATIITVFILLVTLVLHKYLVAVALDRELAKAAKIPVLILDIALYVLVSLCVIVAVRTIGNILVIALLVTPAATARFLTNNVVKMMALAAGIGVFGAVVGIYLSWALDLPAGGSIVLVLTAVFILTSLGNTKHCVLAKFRKVNKVVTS